MTSVKRLLQKKGREVYTASPNLPILEALRQMRDRNVGALPVVENGAVVGIFSERDFARKCCQVEKIDLNVPIRDFMTSPVIFVQANETIEDCMARMTERHIRHLPVLDDNDQLSGIISIGDVVKEVISDHEFMIQNLENYIAGKK
ncbi:MAG TPA: CBS domain-containing protein [Anaerolineaceae bacterium]|jgi:CBS domain-containing protein|nr:CBS domain-containing protein [Anaerolineaceae bacterium]